MLTLAFSSNCLRLILGSCINLSMRFILEEISSINQLFYKIMMNYQNIKAIHEYENLIAVLRPTGIYQVRIIAIVAIYWFMSGINESLFQLAIAQDESELDFMLQQGLQIITILVSAHFSLNFGRYKVNLLSIIILTFGIIILIIGIQLSMYNWEQIGIAIIITFHYSLSIQILLISIQYFHQSMYSKLLMISFASFTLGKMVSVMIYSQHYSNIEICLFVVIPCLILYYLSLVFYRQSPRFLIDQNIHEAQKLFLTIAEVNRIKYEDITIILQRPFFWNRVNLRKYNYNYLFRFNSLNFNTYVIGISLLLLGIVCRCPDFIIHIQNETESSFQVENSVEIIWISIFQLCGLFPSYLSVKVLKRKILCQWLSFFILIMSILLAFFEKQKTLDEGTLFRMVIFGLNSFLSFSLFFILYVSVLEFYPHTIRSLAFSLAVCLYKLGKLLFSIHIESIMNTDVLLQLVVCSSILLVWHTFLISETFNEEIKYEIEQIEEKESEDF